MIASISLALALHAPTLPKDSVIVVSPDGPVRSVSAAVAAVATHGRVVVRRGLYREPLIVIDRPLEISGEPGAVLDGEGRHGLLLVRADDVTVRDLTFRNVGSSFREDRAAIRVEGARGCRIEGNTVQAGFFGIYLARAEGCLVRDNTLEAEGRSETSSGNGIHLWGSDSIVIARNRISGFRDGIYFEFVHRSEVRDNLSQRNLRYGLHFMYSDNCRYQRNVFRANGSGVAVMFTRGVEMEGNQFLESRGGGAYGLLLKEISDARLLDNRFADNTVGVLIEGGARFEVRGNEFVENGRGVALGSSAQGARFLENSFSGNTFDVTTNSIHTSAEFAGNYWDEYRGFDLDHDGRGDVPHRPVRLFSLVVEHNEPTLLLLRSAFVRLLDLAERAIPGLTPDAVADLHPAMVHPRSAGLVRAQVTP